ADYAVTRTPPLCAEWRGHAVLSAPPPMGGPSVLAMLQMSELAGVTQGDGLTVDGEAVVRLAGVQRLVTADAGWWRGDPAVMAVPARGFSSAAYARERAALLPASSPDTAPRGNPWRHEADALPAVCRGTEYPVATATTADTLAFSAPPTDDAIETSFTSHLAVVDAEGNAVSATTTVGVLFGSGIYTGGFFLNSSASNLDARTRGTNRYANSTIAPTLVLERGAVRLAIGAAGSQYIQPATSQVTMRILAFGEDPGAAIAAPRLQTSPLRRDVEVEPGFSSAVYEALVRQGYRPGSRIADLTFGAVHGVFVGRDGRRIGIADPRRDGSAAAQ
ncbi:MAG TPA: gamma-glutamyltransferase, partial [Gemmatimonadaceae bacterium]|nr:gamma-glutamyltransferase [Gemmatimonadaceae bacterium]